MYYINYNTGVGNETAETLKDAKRKADEGAAYTQCDIDIYDDNRNLITTRTWYGCMTDVETMNDPITFGDFGFYADWTD